MNMITKEPTPRVTDPKLGARYIASTPFGLMWIEYSGATKTHIIALCESGYIALRHSETTLYLRQPTRTN